jgi:hypothetical protein
MQPLPVFPVAGGCQCGAVRYELAAPPLTVYNCHCKDCQRFSSGGYAMSMPIRRETLRHVRGDVVAYEKIAGSGRKAVMHACPVCGTKLWNEPLNAPDILILKPGTLDDMSWAEPVGNIWTVSRAPWIEIDPGLTNFEGQPVTRDLLYVAWDRIHGGDQNHGQG